MQAGTESGQSILQDIRILVVDADGATREAIQNDFRGKGAVVGETGNGQASLEMLMQGEFDILIVNVRVEGMNGTICIEEALRIWPWLGVVALVDDHPEAVLEQLRTLGVSRVLSKPLDLACLGDAVAAEFRSRWERLNARHGATGPGVAPDRSRHQLGILRRLTEAIIPAETFVEAMQNLCSSLGELLHSEAVAVLEMEKDARMLVVSLQEAVSRDFVAAIEREALARYARLTGVSVDEDTIRVYIRGRECDEAGARTPAGMVYVPVIARQEIRGVLVFASRTADTEAVESIAFLYEAVSSMSTAMMALRRMHHLSIHDSLTGLFSRMYGQEILRNSLLQAQRYNHAVSVVIIDVDRFRDVNENWGRIAGDSVLREFARVLSRATRESDIAMRYGGEEFVVVLPYATAAEALAFARRFLEMVRAHTFCEASQPLRLRVTIGVASTEDTEGPFKDPDELLTRADQALFLAKHSGSDRVQAWSDVARRRQRPAGEQKGPDGRFDPQIVTVALSKPGRVLVVDDDATIRSLLTRLLSMEGYDVECSESATAALGKLQDRSIVYDIVLTDVHMPGMSGIDLLRKMRELDDSLLGIVMTGYATVDTAIDSLRQGAYDFIQKPIAPAQLCAVLKRALDYRRALLENRMYQLHLEDMVRAKSAELARSLEEVEKSYTFTLEAFAELIDAREPDCYRHSIRVRNVSLILGRAMGLSEEELKVLGQGALLHDIGKVGVPDAILLKPEDLAPEEREIVKKHCEIGFNILKSGSWLEGAAEIVLSHHERYDGRGYPRGRKGEEMCLGARIFTVADAYDAIRSERIYSKGVSPQDAIEEIRSHAGTQFDSQVVSKLLECHGEIEQAVYS